MNSKQDNKEDRLSYPLLDNSLDFLLHAAEHVDENSPRSWKYAILHLIAGIELLLKARLEFEHWSLVFQETDKAKEDKYELGDFRSVDFDSLIQRLDGIASVTISKEDRDHLSRLKQLRNKIEHFGIDIDLNQVKSLMAQGLSYAVSFYEKNIKEETGDYDSEILGEIIKHLHEFEEFVTERRAKITPDIPKFALIRDCPTCSQDTLAVEDGAILHCYFCGYQDNAEELAERHTEADVNICPECGNNALAYVLFDNDSGGWECFACGCTFDNIHKCDSCDNVFNGDGPMCPDCIESMMNRD